MSAVSSSSSLPRAFSSAAEGVGPSAGWPCSRRCRSARACSSSKARASRRHRMLGNRAVHLLASALQALDQLRRVPRKKSPASRTEPARPPPGCRHRLPLRRCRSPARRWTTGKARAPTTIGAVVMVRMRHTSASISAAALVALGRVLGQGLLHQGQHRRRNISRGQLAAVAASHRRGERASRSASGPGRAARRRASRKAPRPPRR